MEHTHLPTRAAALERLEQFVDKAGRAYAQSRNTDFGQDRRDNVSVLSAHIRHRLITEEEVAARVLRDHSLAASEKFIQEVCWRTYWKGWLQMRPAVWNHYRQVRDDALSAVGANTGLETAYRRATTGATGIACFDAWTEELVETGYLHNHARMWFASIWIFTLKLPWALGADFFMQHLLDADAASNTLSWRWVAGLQTRGKTYLARSDNIAKHTNGRFPVTPGLANDAPPLQGPEPPRPASIGAPAAIDWARPTALLLTDDDLTPELLVPVNSNIVAVGALHTHGFRSPDGVASGAAAFAEAAVNDGLTRASRHFGVSGRHFEARDCGSLLADWAADVEQIIMPDVPVGPSKDALKAIDLTAATGRPVLFARRDWDDTLWPHATKGFFVFKNAIPDALATLGCMESPDFAHVGG